jgi:riboflavin biosynthesis pyrimidine reductase
MSATRNAAASVSPFTLLFDETTDDGPGLPADVRETYGSDWRLPSPGERPYVYVNFVLSRDGRISFNEPGRMTGAEVAGFDAHDRWLMGLLRARADAILVGDNTLRIEPDHVWTAEHLCPEDAEAFTSLRRGAGRAPMPLQVFLSLEGDVDVGEAAVFSVEEARIVLATTPRGAERARTLPPTAARLDVLELGEHAVDVRALLARLHDDYGAATVLCEGGPRAYGSLVAAGCVDDEFLSLSPIVIGSRADRPRPGLIEGVCFTPESSPRSRPLSLRRAGDLLFLRSRYSFRPGVDPTVVF